MNNFDRNPYADGTSARGKLAEALEILKEIFGENKIQQIGPWNSQLYIIKPNSKYKFIVKIISAPSNMRFIDAMKTTLRVNKAGRIPFYFLFTRDMGDWPQPTTSGSNYWNNIKTLLKLKSPSPRGVIIGLDMLRDDLIIELLNKTKKIKFNILKHIELKKYIPTTEILKEYGISSRQLKELAEKIELNLKNKYGLK